MKHGFKNQSQAGSNFVVVAVVVVVVDDVSVASVETVG